MQHYFTLTTLLHTFRKSLWEQKSMPKIFLCYTFSNMDCVGSKQCKSIDLFHRRYMNIIEGLATPHDTIVIFIFSETGANLSDTFCSILCSL